MTPSSEPRFVLRGGAEGETSLDSVEALQERIASGAVPPDAELFDASTGRWAPARDVPVFLFILEELEAEGRLPGPLRPLVAPSTSESDTAGEGQQTAADELEVDLPEVQLPGDDPVGPGEASGADADDLPHVEDPFALRMDLVDIPASDDSPPGQTGPIDADPHPGASSKPRQGDTDRADGPEDPADDPAADDEAPAAEPDAAAGSDTEPGASDDEGRPAGFTLDPLEDFSLAALEPMERDEPDRSADSSQRAGEGVGGDEDWFTPAAEGGMVLGPDEEEVVQWEPEGDGESGDVAPPRRKGPAFRTGVVVPVVLVGLAGLSWAIFFGSSEAGETLPEVVVVPEPEVPVIPPVPDDLASQGMRVVARVDQAFRSAVDSVRGDLALAGSPPPAWLSGYYLANAAEFPGVVTFWERYGEFLERLRPIDPEVYRGAVNEAIARETLPDADRERLRGYFVDRYRRQADYRQRRYDDLHETARAAIRLHEVLALHQAEIAFSPALGRGVSADPILEAVIPEGAVRADVDRALDQVFRALDRTRRGGPPSADGLRTELFGGFGDPF